MFWLWKIDAFFFGALIGSFVCALIYRLPRQEDIFFKRTFCDHCQKRIPIKGRIPLVSFLLQKGRCSDCQGKIPPRYFFIELFLATVSAILFPAHVSWDSFGFFLFQFFFIAAMTAHFFIDIDFQLLPNKINLFLLALVLPFSLLHFSWPYWSLGLLLGLGIPALITWLFYKLKGQIGMGGGDIKLFAILGLLFGPIGVMQTLYLSCFLGILVVGTKIVLKKQKRDDPFAFGPYIILVAMIQFFLPEYQLKFLF